MTLDLLPNPSLSTRLFKSTQTVSGHTEEYVESSLSSFVSSNKSDLNFFPS